MNPHRSILAAVLLLASLLLGATHATTLPEALRTAERRSGVVTARLLSGDAERAEARAEADPLALRTDRLQAAQAAALAAADLRSARFDAYLEIAEAYVQVLQLEQQVDVARNGRDLATRGLDIARLRADRGGATELDVRAAQSDLAEAENGLQTAKNALALSRNSFQGLTGLSALELEPVPDELLRVEVPDLDTLRDAIERSPTLLQATQGLELARLARTMLDPSYAARSQIDAAELQIEQAEEGVTEARRGLDLQLRSLVDAVASAREALEVADSALDNARQRESVDRSRLDAGLIAEIAFDQTRLATRQAALAAVTARHDLLLALLDLQAASGVPVEGLHDF